MRAKFLAGTLLFIIIVTTSSCRKNISERSPIPDKGLKEKVIDYIEAKKRKVSDSAKIVIENIKSSIDWLDYATATAPRTTNKQTTFTVNRNKSVNRISSDTYTCLYVIQNYLGNIVSVSTLEIDVPANAAGSLNSLALSLVNNNMLNYTGALTKRNLSGYYIYEIDINNGVPAAYKYMKKKNVQGNRIESCVDWYWQTYENGILVSEVYLFTDCSQGVEEGGSGGSGGTGSGNPSDSTITPCAKADSLNNDTGLQTYLNALGSVTDSSVECGVVKGPGTFGTTYQVIYGNSNEPYLPGISPTSPIFGIYHSHFAGGFSIFSPQDIRYLYNLYKDHMADSSFVFAVTTQTGSYVLHVNNVQNFLNYGDAHLQDEASFNYFQWTTYAANLIWETGTHDGNEAGFLRLLNAENMGVTLFSCDDPALNDWKVKGLNNYNSPINMPC